MCGITGIISFDPDRSIDQSMLKDMNAAMVHRGPDDEGFHFETNAGLGHRRLSIIDLESGRQPIYNEDRSLVLVFNGEIYNFLELRKVLIEKNHKFTTNTDSEVIIHAYEEWGEKALSQFRGMFSFAIWDSRNQKLFLARDRIGIKPLYFALDGKRLLFASELKGITASKSIAKELNLQALADYFSFGYIPSPKTIFKGITKLPAGHFLTFDLEGLSVNQYWDLSFKTSSDLNENIVCHRLIDVITEAIKLRLISDVPLGAFLSGGIDSSLVVAIMAGLMDGPVNTNSIGFDLSNYNELPHANATSRIFKTNHHEYVVSPDALDILDKLAWHFDEPFADSSSIPTYYVSQMTRNNVKVALSGDGGDESFAGYRRYYYDRLENQIRSFIPAPLRRIIFSPLAWLYPKADRLPQFLRAKTLLTNISQDSVFGYFNSMSYVLEDAKKKLFSPDLNNELKGYDSINIFKTHYDNCDSDDPLSRTQYVDFKTYLAEGILTKVDRTSMANSLEVRVPLLDHKLVEYAASLPSSLKLNKGRSKYILKKAAEKLLPEEIFNRPKMGFSIPVKEWLKDELSPLLHESILGSSASNRGLFNRDFIENLVRRHQSGQNDFSQPLWALISFELWAKKHFQ